MSTISYRQSWDYIQHIGINTQLKCFSEMQTFARQVWTKKTHVKMARHYVCKEKQKRKQKNHMKLRTILIPNLLSWLKISTHLNKAQPNIVCWSFTTPVVYKILKKNSMLRPPPSLPPKKEKKKKKKKNLKKKKKSNNKSCILQTPNETSQCYVFFLSLGTE